MLESLKSIWNKWFILTPKNAQYDRTLFWLFIGFMVVGLVMVASASVSVSARYYHGDPFFFTRRSVFYLVAALGICFFCMLIPTSQWEKYAELFFWGTTLLLLLTALFGKEVNGATRWIDLKIINFQSAELAKLATTCFFACYYAKHIEKIQTRPLSFVRAFMYLLASILILAVGQSDLGSTAVIVAIAFSMLFMVGAKLLQFIILFVVLIVGAVIFISTSAYRMKRINTFLDPFADAYGDGFQLANSQMAFGRGEIFGQGLGNSVQKLEYLPEPHTDFIMAIVGEEFGLVGIGFIILLLWLMTLRGLSISREALQVKARFKGLFAFGISIWIFTQGSVNLGVATGLLPTKGLTFPFISYGGSSLMIMAIAVAVLLRIDHENRLARMGQAVAKEIE